MLRNRPAHSSDLGLHLDKTFLISNSLNGSDHVIRRNSTAYLTFWHRETFNDYHALFVNQEGNDKVVTAPGLEIKK